MTVTDRLETLTKYQAQFEDLELKMKGLQAEHQLLSNQFNSWMQNEFGFGEGPQNIAKILKTVLEKSIEPKPQIIT